MVQIRVARPVRNLERTRAQYVSGLDLIEIANFADHDGFDGVILGVPGHAYHFEFTVSRHAPIEPSPTPEDLLVFYIPTKDEWINRCNSMESAGFIRVDSHNPYWDVHGATFQDADGYRIVLENQAWG